jgi:hypothetical protein
VKRFLLSFQKVLDENIDKVTEACSLPPLSLEQVEDGSVLMEWKFKDFRIGFFFGERPEDCGWYLVSNKNLEEASVSGTLEAAEYESVILRMVSFAISFV